MLCPYLLKFMRPNVTLCYRRATYHQHLLNWESNFTLPQHSITFPEELLIKYGFFSSNIQFQPQHQKSKAYLVTLNNCHVAAHKKRNIRQE